MPDFEPVIEQVQLRTWGKIIDVDGHPMPETFTADVTWPGEPMQLTVEVRRGTSWALRSVTITSSEGDVAQVNTWRLASFSSLTRLLLVHAERAFAGQTPVRRRKPIPDYERIASIYMGAAKAPAKTVATELGVSPATATRMIQEAKRARPELFGLVTYGEF